MTQRDDSAGLAYLAGSRPQLVLRYLKHRWMRDIGDLLAESAESLRFDDLDLDNDVVELKAAAGLQAMLGVARAILTRDELIPADAPVLAALQPELSGAQADTFLQLVATNLAFRLRTDELLSLLAAHCARGLGPRLPAAQLGGLLARARPLASARALLEASPLTGRALEEALAACKLDDAPDLLGTRLHVETDHPNLELALERCLQPLRLVAWTDPTPDTRRLLALRRRGGYTTVLEEGAQAPPPELARELARDTAIGRVVWFSLEADQPARFLLLDGTRTVLDEAKLAERLGRPPELDDIAGELRALEILDLDPGHPRGPVKLRFEDYLRHRKKGVKAMAFGQF
jgi:hypothetical protein